MKLSVEEKRLQEKRIVGKMIKIYCKGNHKGEKVDGLCGECAELKAYSELRSDKCPFMETKTFCSNCKVHCYKAEMKEKIRQVMRYSGPRMLLHSPVLTVKHLIESEKEKKTINKKRQQVRG